MPTTRDLLYYIPKRAWVVAVLMTVLLVGAARLAQTRGDTYVAILLLLVFSLMGTMAYLLLMLYAVVDMNERENDESESKTPLGWLPATVWNEGYLEGVLGTLAGWPPSKNPYVSQRLDHEGRGED